MEVLNIYQKIQIIKKDILKTNLKKSGFNNFSNYNYYELSDFLPVIIDLCDKYNVFTQVSFNNEYAELIIRNSENPSEVVAYSSPLRDLEIKGCNKIQALGGVETYSRRYLYMAAFDIVENDMFDCNQTETIQSKLKTDSKILCQECKKEIERNVAEYSYKKYKKVLCRDCQKNIN